MGGCGHKKCKGAMLLVFGVLFLLNTLGVWPEFTLMKYWPVILIVAGLHKLMCSAKMAGMGEMCEGKCKSDCKDGKCDDGCCKKDHK
jgi:hypothetical protein